MPAWLPYLIWAVIAALVAGAPIVLFGFKLPSFTRKEPVHQANYRRGLDALEVLLDELAKAGVPSDELTDWKLEAVQALVKPKQ